MLTNADIIYYYYMRAIGMAAVKRVYRMTL